MENTKTDKKDIFNSLNPLQQQILKAVQEVTKKQVQEAMFKDVPGEYILQQSGIPLVSQDKLNEQINKSSSQSQPVQDPFNIPDNVPFNQKDIQSSQVNTQQPNQQLSNQQQSQGPYIEKNLLVKLFDTLGFRESAQSQLAGSQTRLNLQELAGNKPLQKGEREKNKLKLESDLFTEQYKQDRLDQREMLKSNLESQGISAGSATIASGVSDLISAWDDIKLKGRAGGVAGAIGGALGYQRGERDAFKSFATGLAFSFGEHVLGQKGRAFTDNERKEITKNIIGATLSQTDGQFKSKMNAIIKQVNNKIPEGGEKVPDYDTIRRGMKSSSTQQTMQGTQEVLKSGQSGKALGINFTVE